MNRFENVKDMVGDLETGNNMATVYGQTLNDGLYISCTTEGCDNEFCLTVELFDDAKDDMGYKVHFNNSSELAKLRDFLNYWLEEDGGKE